MSSGVHFAPIALKQYGCTIGTVRSRERLFVLALVALLLAGLATVADARRVRTARSAEFAADLSGTQFAKTDVGPGGVTDNHCQLPSGTSTERIEFEATYFQVGVTLLPGPEVIVGDPRGSTGQVHVPVNGTVTRSNLGEAACLDPDEPGQDCGVRTIPKFPKWNLAMQWVGKGFGLIAGGPAVSDLFDHCSPNLLIDPYPSVFGAADDEPQIVARASIRKLLNRRKKEIVTHGHGAWNTQGEHSTSSVQFDYTLTLTRRKPHVRR
jgi:hypothetical protein